METTHNVNIDGEQKPTWNLVLLLIMTLGLEALTDFTGCVKEPEPDPEQVFSACRKACKGEMLWADGDMCRCEVPALH